MKDQIDDLLYEYGFRRYPNIGTDFRKILLEIALTDIESVHGFDDDELSEWEKSWCDRAREALDQD